MGGIAMVSCDYGEGVTFSGSWWRGDELQQDVKKEDCDSNGTNDVEDDDRCRHIMVSVVGSC